MSVDDKNAQPLDPAHTPDSQRPAEAGTQAHLKWPPQEELSSPLPWPLSPSEPSEPLAQEAAPPHGSTPFSTLLPPPVPDDLRVPWGWVDVLLLAAIGLIGTFAVSLVLILGAGALGVNVTQLRNSTSQQSIFLIVNQVMISIILLVYLAAQMRIRFHAPFWHTIGWKRIGAGTAPRPLAYLGYIFSGFFLALLVQLASAAVGTKAKLPIEVFFQDRRSALLLMVMGVLVAPVVEETIFRGYLYPVVARSFGVTAGILATGILFGLLHAPQLKGGWGQIALLMVVGIVFTYARSTKKTVFASYLLHVSYNSFLFFEFIIASSGFRHLPGQ